MLVRNYDTLYHKHNHSSYWSQKYKEIKHAFCTFLSHVCLSPQLRNIGSFRPLFTEMSKDIISPSRGGGYSLYSDDRDDRSIF